MKPFPVICLFILLVSASSYSQEKLTISLNPTAEQQTKAQLERLLKAYDVTKWIFTKSIVTDEKTAIPHSHPVLTLNVRHIKDDELLLSTLIHEQIHWFMIQDQKALGAAIDDFKKMF